VIPPPHAPAWERELFQILHSRTPADYVGVAQRHGHIAPNLRILAAALEGMLHFEFADTNPAAAHRARSLLAWVVAQHVNLSADLFVQRYLPERRWPVEIVHGVTAALRISDDVLILAAAELHQSADDLPAAIWTVGYATPTAHAALSLADLYSSADRHQDVVDLTNGVTNEDDATALSSNAPRSISLRTGKQLRARASKKSSPKTPPTQDSRKRSQHYPDHVHRGKSCRRSRSPNAATALVTVHLPPHCVGDRPHNAERGRIGPKQLINNRKHRALRYSKTRKCTRPVYLEADSPPTTRQSYFARA